ncbi:PspC domain-containing protein [Corynebacterium pacaense]|uniref:PspC domain-containing protein n=1 Tax=Corynebacterium pacaense TaxID=1816684 RepID=UPI0009BAF4F2|nr:PspC domain-containing protein [Corynebacterium pacaense]
MSTDGYLPFAQEGANTPRGPQGVVRQIWDTRPVRIPPEQGGNAKIAGVCEGIGIRYQIDPVLIRLTFVILGFFGAGISAYLLIWLLLPRYSVPVSPLEAIWKPGHPRDRTHGWWLLIFFLLFSGVFTAGTSDFFSTASALTYVLLAAMFWALYKRHPIPPLGLLPPGSEDTMNDRNYDPNLYPQPQPDLSSITPVEGYPAPFAQQSATSPAWNPLAVNNNAWNAPMAYQQQPPTRRKRRVWPWVLMGLAATGAVSLMIAGTLGSAFYHLDNSEDVTIGDFSVAPTNDQLQEVYSSGIGEMDLDLSKLTPLESPREIYVNTGIGETTITLPTTVPVELTCVTGIGDSNCTPGTYNDGAEGERLKVNLSSGVGDVRVNVGGE